MQFRFVLAITSSLLTIFTNAAIAEDAPEANSEWTLEADVKYFTEAGSSTKLEIGFTPLSAARTIPGYSSLANLVTERVRKCDQWIVVQTLEAHGGAIDSKWFCSPNDGSRVLSGAFGVSGYIEYFSSFGRSEIPNINNIISLLDDTSTPRSRNAASLDAATTYVTYFNGSLHRDAIYDPMSIYDSEWAELESKNALSPVELALGKLEFVAADLREEGLFPFICGIK